MIQNDTTHELEPVVQVSWPWLSPHRMLGVGRTLVQGGISLKKTGQFHRQPEFQKAIFLTPRAKPLSSSWQICAPDSHSSLAWSSLHPLILGPLLWLKPANKPSLLLSAPHCQSPSISPRQSCCSQLSSKKINQTTSAPSPVPICWRRLALRIELQIAGMSPKLPSLLTSVGSWEPLPTCDLFP